MSSDCNNCTRSVFHPALCTLGMLLNFSLLEGNCALSPCIFNIVVKIKVRDQIQIRVRIRIRIQFMVWVRVRMWVQVVSRHGLRLVSDLDPDSVSDAWRFLCNSRESCFLPRRRSGDTLHWLQWNSATSPHQILSKKYSDINTCRGISLSMRDLNEISRNGQHFHGRSKTRVWSDFLECADNYNKWDNKLIF